jgi:peptidoglycan/LPS O-acetylase OafA/YrhL
MPGTSTRIESLDGLRAISILLVLTSHSINAFGHDDPLVLGSLGVRVFFVISGFLITGLLLQELNATDTIDLVKFYFRRTLRIFPPFYFFLLVMFVLALWGWVTLPLADLVPPLTYTTNYIAIESRKLAHSWSLAVEEQFYLLWPGVLLLFGKKRAFHLLCLVLIVSPVIRIVTYQMVYPFEPKWLALGFQANLDALGAGCLLAFARQRLHASRFYRRVINSNLVLVLPAVVVVANLQGPHPHLFDGLCIPVMNVLIAIIIDWAVLNHAGRVGRILNSRLFMTIGVMSYSIYLWQQPFLTRSVSTIPQFLFRIACILLVSSASYLIVERYSLQLRKRLQGKLFGRWPVRLSGTPLGVGASKKAAAGA